MARETPSYVGKRVDVIFNDRPATLIMGESPETSQIQYHDVKYVPVEFNDRPGFVAVHPTGYKELIYDDIHDDWEGPQPEKRIEEIKHGDTLLKIMDRTGRRGFIEAMGDHSLDEWVPIWESLQGAFKMGELAAITQVINEGGQPTDEQLVKFNIMRAIDRRRADQNWRAHVAEGAHFSWNFGASLGLANLWSKLLSRKATTMAVSEAAGERIAKATTKALVQKLGRRANTAAAKAYIATAAGFRKGMAKAIPRGLLASGVRAGAFVEAAQQRRIENMLTSGDPHDVSSALLAVADVGTEHFSEFTGEMLGGAVNSILKGAANKIGGAVGREFIDTAKNRILNISAVDWMMKHYNPKRVADLKRLMRYGGIDSWVEEIYEERLGGFIRGLLGVTAGDLKAPAKQRMTDAVREGFKPGFKQLGIEMATFALPALMRTGAGFTVGRAVGRPSPLYIQENREHIHNMHQSAQTAEEISENVGWINDRLNKERRNKNFFRLKGMDWLYAMIPEGRGTLTDMMEHRRIGLINEIYDAARDKAATELEKLEKKEKRTVPQQERMEYLEKAGERAVKEHIENLGIKVVKTQEDKAKMLEHLESDEIQIRGIGKDIEGQTSRYDFFATPDISSDAEFRKFAARTGVNLQLPVATVTDNNDALQVNVDMVKAPGAMRDMFGIEDPDKARKMRDYLVDLMEDPEQPADFFILPYSALLYGSQEDFEKVGYPIPKDWKPDKEGNFHRWLGAYNIDGNVYLNPGSIISDVTEDTFEALLDRSGSPAVTGEAQTWLENAKREAKRLLKTKVTDQEKRDLENFLNWAELGDSEVFVKAFIHNKLGVEPTGINEVFGRLNRYGLGMGQGVVEWVKDRIPLDTLKRLSMVKVGKPGVGKGIATVEKALTERKGIAKAREAVAKASEQPELVEQLAPLRAALEPRTWTREARENALEELEKIKRSGISFSIGDLVNMDRMIEEMKGNLGRDLTDDELESIQKRADELRRAIEERMVAEAPTRARGMREAATRPRRRMPVKKGEPDLTLAEAEQQRSLAVPDAITEEGERVRPGYDTEYPDLGFAEPAVSMEDLLSPGNIERMPQVLREMTEPATEAEIELDKLGVQVQSLEEAVEQETVPEAELEDTLTQIDTLREQEDALEGQIADAEERAEFLERGLFGDQRQELVWDVLDRIRARRPQVLQRIEEINKAEAEAGRAGLPTQMWVERARLRRELGRSLEIDTERDVEKLLDYVATGMPRGRERKLFGVERQTQPMLVTEGRLQREMEMRGVKVMEALKAQEAGTLVEDLREAAEAAGEELTPDEVEQRAEDLLATGTVEGTGTGIGRALTDVQPVRFVEDSPAYDANSQVSDNVERVEFVGMGGMSLLAMRIQRLLKRLKSAAIVPMVRVKDMLKARFTYPMTMEQASEYWLRHVRKVFPRKKRPEIKTDKRTKQYQLERAAAERAEEVAGMDPFPRTFARTATSPKITWRPEYQQPLLYGMLSMFDPDAGGQGILLVTDYGLEQHLGQPMHRMAHQALTGRVPEGRVIPRVRKGRQEPGLLSLPASAKFHELPEKSTKPKTMTYTGIGSRQTPAKVQKQMQKEAARLSKKGYILNTGDARGADASFAEGATEANIFDKTDATDYTRRIAKEIHPAPNKLSPTALDLMARNTKQVFGEDLETPADFVLVWTPDGAETAQERRESRRTGGSGQAIEMASRKGIPVINMANKGWKKKLADAEAGKLDTTPEPTVEKARATVEFDTTEVSGQMDLPIVETDLISLAEREQLGKKALLSALLPVTPQELEVRLDETAERIASWMVRNRVRELIVAGLDAVRQTEGGPVVHDQPRWLHRLQLALGKAFRMPVNEVRQIDPLIERVQEERRILQESLQQEMGPKFSLQGGRHFVSEAIAAELAAMEPGSAVFHNGYVYRHGSRKGRYTITTNQGDLVADNAMVFTPKEWQEYKANREARVPGEGLTKRYSPGRSASFMRLQGPQSREAAEIQMRNWLRTLVRSWEMERKRLAETGVPISDEYDEEAMLRLVRRIPRWVFDSIRVSRRNLEDEFGPMFIKHVSGMFETRKTRPEWSPPKRGVVREMGNYFGIENLDKKMDEFFGSNRWLAGTAKEVVNNLRDVASVVPGLSEKMDAYEQEYRDFQKQIAGRDTLSLEMAQENPFQGLISEAKYRVAQQVRAELEKQTGLPWEEAVDALSTHRLWLNTMHDYTRAAPELVPFHELLHAALEIGNQKPEAKEVERSARELLNSDAMAPVRAAADSLNIPLDWNEFAVRVYTLMSGAKEMPIANKLDGLELSIMSAFADLENKEFSTLVDEVKMLPPAQLSPIQRFMLQVKQMFENIVRWLSDSMKGITDVVKSSVQMRNEGQMNEKLAQSPRHQEIGALAAKYHALRMADQMQSLLAEEVTPDVTGGAFSMRDISENLGRELIRAEAAPGTDLGSERESELMTMARQFVNGDMTLRERLWDIIKRLQDYGAPGEYDRAAQAYSQAIAVATKRTPDAAQEAAEQLDFNLSLQEATEFINDNLVAMARGQRGLHKLLIDESNKMRLQRHRDRIFTKNVENDVGIGISLKEKSARGITDEQQELAKRMLHALKFKVDSPDETQVIEDTEYIDKEDRKPGDPDYRTLGPQIQDVLDEWDAKRPKGTPSSKQIFNRFATDKGRKGIYHKRRQDVEDSVQDIVRGQWIGFIQNYVSRTYKLRRTETDKEVRTLGVKRIVEDTKHARGRIFETLREAAEKKGLVPADTGIQEEFLKWSDNVWWATRNRMVLSGAALLRDTDGAPKVVPMRDPGKAKAEGVAVSDKVYEELLKNLSEWSGEKYDKTADPMKELQRMTGAINMKKEGYLRLDSPATDDIDYFWVRGWQSKQLMRHVIDSPFDNWFVNGWRRLNTWMKYAELLWSFFHPASLGESYVSMHGIKLQNPIWHPRKRIKELRALLEDVRYNPEQYEKFLRHNLTLDFGNPNLNTGTLNEDIRTWRERRQLTIHDKDKPFIQRYLAQVVDKQLERLYNFKQWNDRWLWHNFHPAVKLASAIFMEQTLMNEYGRHLDDDEYDQIGNTVNDAFGGQNWDRYLFANPKVMQILHLLTFAPDWTLSAANISSVTHWVPGVNALVRPEIRDIELSWAGRKYWPAMVAFVLIGIPNMMQAAFTGLAKITGHGDPDDKWLTFQNERGKKGSVNYTPIARMMGYKGKRQMYYRLAKQAYEVFLGWLGNTERTMKSKLSPVVRTALEQITGRDSIKTLPFAREGLGGFFGILQAQGSFMKSRTMHVTKKFMPMWVVNYLEGRPATIFAPASRGASFGSTVEQLEHVLDAYADPGVWRRLSGKTEVQLNLMKLGEDILESAKRNGVDAGRAYDRAKAHVLYKYYTEFFAELNNGKRKKRLEEVGKSIIRLHGTLDRLNKAMGSRYMQRTELYGTEDQELTEQVFHQAFRELADGE